MAQYKPLFLILWLSVVSIFVVYRPECVHRNTLERIFKSTLLLLTANVNFMDSLQCGHNKTPIYVGKSEKNSS